MAALPGRLARALRAAQRVDELVEGGPLGPSGVATKRAAQVTVSAPRLAAMHPSVAGTAGSMRSAAAARLSRCAAASTSQAAS